jgi:hypothetical protein
MILFDFTQCTQWSSERNLCRITAAGNYFSVKNYGRKVPPLHSITLPAWQQAGTGLWNF